MYAGAFLGRSAADAWLAAKPIVAAASKINECLRIDILL
jgi:hypothetical protein